jgi:trehalose 6-phosphate phosphatase
LPEIPELFEPLLRHPERSALFLDFDGTLSAIVAEPLAARPLPGVPALLARLARTVGLVAVISGRPNSFLGQVLDTPPGVLLVGLYGLELALAAEGQEAQAAAWADQIAAVVLEAQAEAPEGAFVEPKGLTVTLHWRQAP